MDNHLDKSDEKVCHQYVETIRFKDGDYCPHCGNKEILRFADGKRYRCHSCRLDFTIKTGTLFGESEIPLHLSDICHTLLQTLNKIQFYGSFNLNKLIINNMEVMYARPGVHSGDNQT